MSEAVICKGYKTLLYPTLTSPDFCKGQHQPNPFLSTQSSTESDYLCLEGVDMSEKSTVLHLGTSFPSLLGINLVLIGAIHQE